MKAQRLYEPGDRGPLPANSVVYLRKFKLPLYNVPVAAISSFCGPTTATKLLVRQLKDWTAEDHERSYHYHLQRAEKLDKIWKMVWERAFKEAHGRPPMFADYRICAIGDENLSERHMRVLRHCAYSATDHQAIAQVHRRCSDSVRRRRKVK